MYLYKVIKVVSSTAKTKQNEIKIHGTENNLEKLVCSTNNDFSECLFQIVQSLVSSIPSACRLL